MTTRRNFIKSASAAATGVVFCNCGLLEAAHAQQPVAISPPIPFSTGQPGVVKPIAERS